MYTINFPSLSSPPFQTKTPTTTIPSLDPQCLKIKRPITLVTPINHPPSAPYPTWPSLPSHTSSDFLPYKYH